MKIEQRSWSRKSGWKSFGPSAAGKCDLVLVFGDTALLKEGSVLREVERFYPGAHLFGCSTSGEILGTKVQNETLTTTAICFQKTKIANAQLSLASVANAKEAGERLANMIPHADLSHVLVLSIGLNVNGSELVQGLASRLPSDVVITGGLAGDQDRFQETLVVSGKLCSNNQIAIVGLYGKGIRTSSASLGGWDVFGPERLVTKSKGNILYELDGKSALELYKKYLGEYANELPGSALLFPLCLRSEDGGIDGVVRTVLGVDESNQTLTFAGDVPQGARGRFMKANFDRLIEGAVGAAEKCSVTKPELALLVSCVGRKIVLNERIEEEVEGVRKIFGDRTVLTGFYSYGEISPFTPTAKCELHNQTMTITTLTETDEDAA
jgi:hypothetical protein